MRAIFTACMLLVFVLMITTSCEEPEPAEIGVISTLNGKERGCTVNVYTKAGKQIQQQSTDHMGIGYIKSLAPGMYRLTFEDIDGNLYPAEEWVTVRSGDSLPVKIELSKGPETTE